MDYSAPFYSPLNPLNPLNPASPLNPANQVSDDTGRYAPMTPVEVAWIVGILAVVLIGTFAYTWWETR